MKSVKKLILVFVAVVWISSCDLNKLDNPSLLSANSADATLLLNGIQLNYADFFYNIGDAGMSVARQVHFYGPIYNNNFIPSYFNYVWQAAYTNMLVNTENLIKIGTTQKLYFHTGMAKIFQAATMLNMVDFFGDVPYSKAIDPSNFNPPADKDSDVYAAALTMLDDAIADFGKVAPPPPQDLYYGGNKNNWIAFANTLKLKVYLNKRLVDASGSTAAIAALLVSNANLIDAADGSEDFVFQYSTVLANPDSRHPYFSGNYIQGAGTYHTNWLMWNMRYGKPGAIDPRIRYYYYRQVDHIDRTDPTLTNVLACNTNAKPARYLQNPNWPYCVIQDALGNNDGYWGRDYGDASGVGPDTKIRTNWGVYPIGGKYDGDTGVPTGPGDGLAGAGIAPIMMSSYVKFMLAEAALYLGVGGGVGAVQGYLDAAVDISIKRVMSFGASAVDVVATVPTAGDISAYESAVDANYNAAATPNDQMEVIAKEYWIASFGNGVESYNMYRRTGGKPSDMQWALRDPGIFPSTMPYPLVYTAQNNSAPIKLFSRRVFWDTDPATKVN